MRGRGRGRGRGGEREREKVRLQFDRARRYPPHGFRKIERLSKVSSCHSCATLVGRRVPSRILLRINHVIGGVKVQSSLFVMGIVKAIQKLYLPPRIIYGQGRTVPGSLSIMVFPQQDSGQCLSCYRSDRRQSVSMKYRSTFASASRSSPFCTCSMKAFISSAAASRISSA